MRRYKLDIDSKEFVLDVQELDVDQFEVVVDGQAYVVSLAEECAGEAAPAPTIAPAARPAAVAAPRPAAAAAPAPAAAAPRKQPAGGGGKGALKAPMPGTILEVHVKPGDKVTRGQKIAILDAMKMHNLVGAPKDGVIAEVCVSAGQAVAHGDVIVTFQEG